MALCSLSIGSRVRRRFSRTARMKTEPAMTSASLLASRIFLPATAAARVGGKPAAPTMAAITASTSGSSAIRSSASGPHAPPRSGSRREQARGEVGSQRRIAKHRVTRLEFDALREQAVHLTMRAKGHHADSAAGDGERHPGY
jgi:hypothetical protein